MGHELANRRYQFHIDLKEKFVFIKHFGVLDKQIILDRRAAVEASDLFTKDLNRIYDFSGCEIHISSDDLRAVAKSLEPSVDPENTYRAALIIDSDLAHGLGRMFGSAVSTLNIDNQIFNRNSENFEINLKGWLRLPINYGFPEFLRI